jgi:hypothetical protein
MTTTDLIRTKHARLLDLSTSFRTNVWSTKLDELRKAPEDARRAEIAQLLPELAKLVNDQGGVEATQHIGSDSYAVRVNRMTPSGKTVFVTARGEREQKYTWREKGGFRSVGGGSSSLGLGYAEDYLDPSF